jgi:hypothetical protein
VAGSGHLLPVALAGIQATGILTVTLAGIQATGILPVALAGIQATGILTVALAGIQATGILPVEAGQKVVAGQKKSLSRGESPAEDSRSIRTQFLHISHKIRRFCDRSAALVPNRKRLLSDTFVLNRCLPK